MLKSAAMSWFSKTQKVSALSEAEAEYMTMVGVVYEFLF